MQKFIFVRSFAVPFIISLWINVMQLSILFGDAFLARFLHYWPFVSGIYQWLLVDTPFKGPVMQNFYVFDAFALNTLLNK